MNHWVAEIEIEGKRREVDIYERYESVFGDARTYLPTKLLMLVGFVAGFGLGELFWRPIMHVLGIM